MNSGLKWYKYIIKLRQYIRSLGGVIEQEYRNTIEYGKSPTSDNNTSV